MADEEHSSGVDTADTEDKAEEVQSDSEAKIKGDQTTSEKDNSTSGDESTEKYNVIKVEDANNKTPSDTKAVSEGRLSRASSRTSSAGKDAESRAKSGGSESGSKGRNKKPSSAIPGSHRVTFTVTIAMAIPTGEKRVQCFFLQNRSQL